jgi:hypothetical protein
MTVLIIQVQLSIPDGVENQLLMDEYAELVEEFLTEQHERGRFPGVSQIKAEATEYV